MKESKKIKIWFVILMALIQFPLKLAGNLRYGAYVFVYLIPFLYLIKNLNITFNLLTKRNNKRIAIFKFLLLYLILISLIWPILLGTYDFTYVTVYWRGYFLWILKYLFLVVVFLKHIDKEGSFDLFAKHFIVAVSLYVSFSIITLIPAARNYAMKIIYISTDYLSLYNHPQSYTRFGWTGWSGFNETTVCSFAVLLGCILIIKETNKKKKFDMLLQLIIPVIGNALYGRIGLLASVLCIGLMCIYVILDGNGQFAFKTICICTLGLFIFIMLKDKITILGNMYKWIFSAFKNYLEYGKFYDSMGSIEHLLTDMYWVPDIKTLLIGDGRYTDGSSYYMHTDSGIMRPILYYGVINYFISIFGLVSLANRFTSRLLNAKKSKLIIQFIICIFVFVFEFKGESLWMTVGMLFPIALMLEYSNLKYDV